MVQRLDIDPSTISTSQQKGEQIKKNALGQNYILHFVKKKVKVTQKRLVYALKDVYKHSFHADKDTPVLLSVEFIYRLGSKPKRFAGKYKVTRPDTDNLLKNLLDAGTSAGLWNDDNQVQIMKACRRYADQGEDAHIKIELKTSI